MTISFVGAAAVEANSIGTMPTHAKGDLLVFFAWNGGSSTVPTTPADCSILFNGTRAIGANRAYSLGYKQAASSSETSGTWTNAAILGVVVYRHSTNVITIGGANMSQDINSTSFPYAAIVSRTSQNFQQNKIRNGDTWIVGVGGINANNLAIETPPSGMTNRLNLAGTSANEISIHDTNGNVSSWSTTNVTLAATAVGTSITFEIYDTGVAKSSGGLILPQTMLGGYTA